MKLVHLSDLHLGKRLNEFPLLEDQEYILSSIIGIIDLEEPEGVIIAGDIYDKAVPSAEAVELFDDFLFKLEKRKTKVFIISGNHDSAERISFGGRIMYKSGVFISPVYDGNIRPISLKDEFGTLNIYMLPFVKPANVRRWFPDEEILSYSDAVKCAISHMDIDLKSRNILVTHQFVTGAARCDSEDISVGGADNVDASVFKDFDYVALGHIHGPQNIINNKIRYCGTPLKYSFSEANHKKSVTIVELFEKGNIKIKEHFLIPKHDLVELKGKYSELALKSFYENTTYSEDYMHITLTDEEEIPYALNKLRVIYHKLIKLDYDNKRTQGSAHFNEKINIEKKTPQQLFFEFYEKQNNQPMNQKQRSFIDKLMDEIWEDEL